ncbi:MAG: hypothetical protein K6C98_02520 [Treponema sp.]|nr:hypothetical protein [Treponema sp.]
MGNVEYNPRVCPFCGFFNYSPEEHNQQTYNWCEGVDDSVLDIDCTEEVKKKCFSDYAELMKQDLVVSKKDTTESCNYKASGKIHSLKKNIRSLNMTLEAQIQKLGFVGSISASRREFRMNEKESTTEDYVGKITALFSPYISPKNISETKFVGLQENLKKIVVEIKGK